jgi:hypothetical protein
MRRKAGIMRLTKQLVLLIALIMALGVTAYAEDLVPTDSNVSVQYNVDPAYPWQYDAALTAEKGTTVFVAGNSGEDHREASVSNVAFTVTGKGTLTFDYQVDTPEDGDATYKGQGQYYGLFYQVGSAITTSNCTSAANFDKRWALDYAAKEGWSTVTVPINASDIGADGMATVYVAYVRSGNADEGDANYVAIANVSFTSDQKTLTVIGDDSSDGSVTVTVGGETQTAASTDGTTSSYEVSPGASATLTASVSSGVNFYGWTDGSTLLSTDLIYTTTVNENTTIYAIYAAPGHYTARRNGIFYTESDGLQKALNGASSGDTIVMLASQTLSGSATVPAGATLLLPCMDNDVGYVDGYAPKSTDEGLDSNKVQCYGTLTIPKGITLTVNGTLLVNAVTGLKNGNSEQGIISGGFAAIALDGDIDVTGSKAVLDNFGTITGSGQVSASNGGTVGDRYEVTNWRGGTNASGAYGVGVYPMNETNCHSIQTTVTIESNATFVGLVRMYEGWFGYHDARFQLIGGLGAMIQLNSGASATKTYEDGRSIVTLNGGAAFSGSSMTIADTDVFTRDYVFPVDGDVSLVLERGTYTVEEDYKLLPGSSAELMPGATLTVSAGKTLALYESFHDTFDANQYPSGRNAAELILHGGSTLRVDGTIGGHVRLDSGASDTSYAKVILSSGAAITSVTKESTGYYDNVTAEEFTFALQLLDSNGTTSTTLTAGKTYYGTATGWTTTNPVKLPGDLDNNNTVDINDLDALLANYGKNGSGLVGDINSDSTVDINDLDTLLSYYGKST